MPLRLPELGELVRFPLEGPFGEGFPPTFMGGEYPAFVIKLDEEKQRVFFKVFTEYKDIVAGIPYEKFMVPDPPPVDQKSPEPVVVGDPLGDDLPGTKEGEPRYVGPPIPVEPEKVFEDVPPPEVADA